MKTGAYVYDDDDAAASADEAEVGGDELVVDSCLAILFDAGLELALTR